MIMLYTTRQYPCGCCAEGPGDVPACCPKHETGAANLRVDSHCQESGGWPVYRGDKHIATFSDIADATAYASNAHETSVPTKELVLREALECLLPGLILDLRYATDDDDKDAMRSRIATVQDALAGAGPQVPAPLGDAAVLELQCLLQEAVTLAELGDITEDTEAHGWGAWLKQARSAVKAPEEHIYHVGGAKMDEAHAGKRVNCAQCNAEKTGEKP